MRIIDNNFNDIQGVELKYSKTFFEIYEYLKNKIDNDKVMFDMMNDNEKIIIQEMSGIEYAIKMPNGSIKKNKISESVGALKTNMIISIDDNELRIIPGVALRSNFTNHQLVHELLHAISSNQHNYFNEEGILYTKTGTKIDYYDKNLNDYSKIDNLSSNGLNEGITELLASIITNEYTGNYSMLVVVAKLLMSSNNNLLNAYFSNNLDQLEYFYSDLEARQSVISREDLCQLESVNTDVDLVAKIIVGAVKYNESYNYESEIDSELAYLDNNFILDN